MKIVYIATTSNQKLAQLSAFFSLRNIQVVSLDLDIPEVQLLHIQEVCRKKLHIAMQQSEKRPLLVDDVGLSIPSLNGFPGAILKPILDAGGVGLLDKLTCSVQQNRKVSARYQCVIGLALIGGEHFGVGEVTGTLDFSISGTEADRQCSRIFFPDGSVKSLLEQFESTTPRIYQHRTLALEAALTKAEGKL